MAYFDGKVRVNDISITYEEENSVGVREVSSVMFHKIGFVGIEFGTSELHSLYLRQTYWLIVSNDLMEGFKIPFSADGAYDLDEHFRKQFRGYNKDGYLAARTRACLGGRFDCWRGPLFEGRES